MSHIISSDELRRWAPQLLIANAILTLGLVWLDTSGVAAVVHIAAIAALTACSGLLVGLTLADERPA